jgi:hypothetical protein
LPANKLSLKQMKEGSNLFGMQKAKAAGYYREQYPAGGMLNLVLACSSHFSTSFSSNYFLMKDY